MVIKSFSQSFIPAFLAAIFFVACSTPARIAQPVVHTTDSGLTYEITRKGSGPLAQKNDMVFVHYTLRLEDGTLIDSSHEREEPIYFKLGAAQVIKGWEEAMTYLRKGDQARIEVPPHLGYGDRGVGQIPANASLFFEVEIIDIQQPAKPFDMPENAQKITTMSGLSYAVIKPGKGTMVVPGMRVKVHYSGYFEDFSLFDSSRERVEPIEFVLGKGMVIRGWEEAIPKFREGDIARLWIPYPLAYGEQGRGPIPPATNLIFDIEIIEAIEIENPKPFAVAGLDTLVLESGLKYIVVNQGSGKTPERGQMTIVHYTGFLPNGNIFDSSVQRNQPFRFVVGEGQVIPGWDEGVMLMKKGARYRFIIPPDLGYGERGIGPIPPNSTLVFDVELLEIR